MSMMDITITMLLSFVGLGWWLWRYEHKEEVFEDNSDELIRKDRQRLKDLPRGRRPKYNGALLVGKKRSMKNVA